MILFIHEPDFGADFSQDGNMAKRVKGMANAKENPNIPIAGPAQLPEVTVCTSSSPMIGAVQEKEIKTRAKAIRKIEISPVVFAALESTAFPQLSGSLISNQPKNEKAKRISRRNRITLKTAFVARELRVLGPNIAVMRIPRAKKITMIDKPYKEASRIPLLLLPPRFRKKLIVIGMIGQIQGIINANRPPMKPIQKI